MIRSFKDRMAEAVFRGESPRGFPSDLVKIARRKLGYLDAAVDLRDLRQPPAIVSKRSRVIARANTQSGLTTSSEFASCGRLKARQTSK
jgi:proteic killer suppression protein